MTTADGRSPDSRVVVSGRLPRSTRSSGRMTETRRSQLRGQLRHWGYPRTAFPFNPQSGETVTIMVEVCRHASQWPLSNTCDCRAPKRDQKSPKPSSTKNKLARRATVLPTGSLQFRTFDFIQRIAEAKISDKTPVWRNIKNLADNSGIQDRHPSHANPLRPSRQPD